MQSPFRSRSHAWDTRREAWLTALALWVGGIGFAGAAVWHAQHPVSSSLAPRPIATFADGSTTSTDGPAAGVDSTHTSSDDSTDTSGIVFMPQDVIVAHRAGAAQMQKP